VAATHAPAGAPKNLLTIRAACGYVCHMNIEELRKVSRAVPFQPFTVRTSEGDGLPVPHPDFLFIPPMGQTVIIVDQKGGLNLVDATHITKVEIPRPGLPQQG